jgi:Peptidase C39 family
MPSSSNRDHRRVVFLTLLVGCVLTGAAAKGEEGESDDAAPAFRLRHAFPTSNEESCGIDTLYLCAKIQSYEPSLRQLEESLPLTRRGASLASLAEAARSNGFASELLRTDLAQLRRWQRPAVLHVNDSHYIGYVGTTDDGRLLLFDNSVGLLDCTPEWFARRYRWGGDSLVLGAMPKPWQEALLSPWVLVPGCVALLLLSSVAWPRPHYREPLSRPSPTPTRPEGDLL